MDKQQSNWNWKMILADEKLLVEAQHIEDDIVYELVNNFQTDEKDEPENNVLNNTTLPGNIGHIDENDTENSFDIEEITS